jgi:iron complex transport system substrate-binding protein
VKRTLLLISLLVFVLAACSSQAQGPSAIAPQPAATLRSEPIIVTDALGRQVTLPASPERIVLTGKAVIMIADAAYAFSQASQRIIGMGTMNQDVSNFIGMIDPNFDQKTRLENNAAAEQIAALKPDLVLLKSYLAETVGQPIEALGIPVIYLDFETPEQFQRDLAILGKIFQDDARAQDLAAYYQAGVEGVQAAIKDQQAKPRVLMLYYNDKDGKVAFNVPPLSWMQTRMVELAGGEPVWAKANLSQGWTQVSLEQVAAWDPDDIFIISYTGDPSEIVAGLRQDPQWQALRAVKEGRLYGFPGDSYSWDQPDTRWILGLKWLASRLYPEQFTGQDITAAAKDFYQQVYGLNSNFFEQNIRPNFRGSLP